MRMMMMKINMRARVKLNQISMSMTARAIRAMTRITKVLFAMLMKGLKPLLMLRVLGSMHLIATLVEFLSCVVKMEV